MPKEIGRARVIKHCDDLDFFIFLINGADSVAGGKEKKKERKRKEKKLEMEHN